MQVVTPPHNLEELLAVMAVKDEINMGTIEQAIMASPWVEKFRAYLRRMKLEDDENILKFLILVQVLYCDSEVLLLSCLTIFNPFPSLNLFCHPYPYSKSFCYSPSSCRPKRTTTSPRSLVTPSWNEW